MLHVELKGLDKRKISLQDTYSVHFDMLRGRQILAAQFLRRNKDGYFIELLGKNGEPKKGFIANLSFALFDYHQTV